MVKWKGLPKAKSRLRTFGNGIDDQLEQGLHDFGDYAEGQIKENAVFVKGYSTGNLKRQINNQHLPMSASIKSPAYYSGWVEHGTRYMDAQPFFFVTIDKIKYDIGKFIMRR